MRWCRLRRLAGRSRGRGSFPHTHGVRTRVVDHRDLVAVAHVASQQRIGELRFHFKTDLALEHPRAEFGVIADLRKVTHALPRAVRLRMQWRVWLAGQTVMVPGARSDAEYEQQRAGEQRIHADQPDER